MNQELCFSSIAKTAKLLASREISPVELTRAYYDRIEQFDTQVSSFITLTQKQALEGARRAEQELSRGLCRGPLHGIPFAVKDIYDTAGILTSGNSKTGVDNIPAENATAVQRLYDAGAVLLGKLATHEFASGGPALDLPWPPPRNPWNLEYFTGGSSSGSGASVAAGFTPFALGSDTGGSIRIPAAFCGVVGLKPTYGRVSRHGVIPNSFTLDHCGPLTGTVEDSAIVLQYIAGYDPQDRASSRLPVPDFRSALTGDIRGVRIGFLAHFWEHGLASAAEAKAAMYSAIEVFRKLGANIGEARMRSAREYDDVKTVISKAEILAIHDKDLRERPGDFCMDFLGRNLPGCLFQASDYVQAQRLRRRMLEDMKHIYHDFDVLLTPTTAPAGRLDALVGREFRERWSTPNIYAPFNVTGGPALVLCNGFATNGLPLAMQIAGRPFNESNVLRVAHAYEQATHWRAQRPALQVGMKAPPLMLGHPAGYSAPPDDVKQAVDAAIARAGWNLDEHQRQLIYTVAPDVLATAQRLRRNLPRSDEPADVFCFTEQL